MRKIGSVLRIAMVAALLLVSALILLHLTRKDAQASWTNFTCYLEDIGSDPVNSDDIIMHIYFYEDEEDEEPALADDMIFVDLENGYSYSIEGAEGLYDKVGNEN